MMNDDAMNQVIHDDCLYTLEKMENTSIDMVYLDPPFFTNKHHSSVTRDRNQQFSFADVWSDLDQYAQFIESRIQQIHRVLKNTGAVFVHCDTHANFLLRTILDTIFGRKQFRSEIIWAYKRWSNSAKGLLPAHQTIFFYSKTDQFKFNRIYTAYSETTNIDQILQRRTRDKQGISIYATDDNGNVIFGNDKKGIPLNDVWDIPFLNPKAKERTGYPTQKPILLLERLIKIATDPNDLVLDPFCGSGTTLVAAKLLDRQFIGIDCSEEAVALSKSRLNAPFKTDSHLLRKGRNSYINVNHEALALLTGLEILPVQRNTGIDAFVKIGFENTLIPIRVQRDNETIIEAAMKLARAAHSKKAIKAILVRTKKEKALISEIALPNLIELVDSTALNISEKLLND
jgi:site-specific DNA-methyltransferase (adenine-specific)